MTLTASDVSSLARSLSHWEDGEYFCAFLVALACAGEYIAGFTNCFTGGVRARKVSLEKKSTLLLILALVMELICLVRTNQLSGRIVGSLSDKAEEASTKSQSALDDASTATISAKQAVADAGNAKTEADGAEKESKAVSREAAGIATELVKSENTLYILKSLSEARHLPDQKGLIEKLRPFNGTGAMFESYAPDATGYSLCESLFFSAHSAQMNATDLCGRIPYPTDNPVFTGVGIFGPDESVATNLANVISRVGRLGVTSGTAAHPLIVFVGVQYPFWLGDDKQRPSWTPWIGTMRTVNPTNRQNAKKK